MDGSPLCVRSPLKDINNTLSFISNDLKRHILSPQIFRKRYEIYSPVTELSLNLNDLTTTTPDSRNSSVNVTPKRRLELNDTPCESPLAIREVRKDENFTTPLSSRTSNHVVSESESECEKEDDEENGPNKSLGLHRLDSLRINKNAEEDKKQLTRSNPDDFDTSSQEGVFSDNDVKPSANINILFQSPSKNSKKSRVSSPTREPVSKNSDSSKTKKRNFSRRRNLFRSVTFSGAKTVSGEDPDSDQENLGVALLSSVGTKRPSSSSGSGPESKAKKSCEEASPLDVVIIKPSIFKKPMPSIKPPLLRSQSEVFVKNVMNYAETNKDLIGDYSTTYVLPSIVPARHQDLRTIDVATIKSLLRGDFSESVSEYIIVDCRYPYEFEGGHISGAVNLYNKQHIVDRFLTPTTFTTLTPNRRTVVIFHCEFSSERGPKMFRFLRNRDRDCHKECYPDLYFPEIYLLAGGYKEFYETSEAFCEPNTYVPMLHPDYSVELRRFRSKKSKFWNGDKRRINSRIGMGH